MTKTYKVSYKTYLNTRLKQVPFHGKLTHPLYVQLTYDRKTIFFKSYYFELFSKPRYARFAAGKRGGPTITQVIEKENELIDFVIDKTLPDFSLDGFKEAYWYYGRDLCDLTEPGFSDYLFTFFQDKGMPALATALKEGGKFRNWSDVVRDLKKALNRPLYDELIENSFYYAPPYLPLFGFMMQSKKWPMLCLTVMEWEIDETIAKFASFVVKNFSSKDSVDVVEQVNSWLAYSKETKK